MRLLSLLQGSKPQCESCTILRQRDTLGQTLAERNMELAAERAAAQQLRIDKQLLTQQLEAAGDARRRLHREKRQALQSLNVANHFAAGLQATIETLKEQNKRLSDENILLGADAEAYENICSASTMRSKSNRRQHPGHHGLKGKVTG